MNRRLDATIRAVSNDSMVATARCLTTGSFKTPRLRTDGGPERQLTFSDESYVEPDLVAASKVFASRVRMQSDIWRFPVTGSAGDNTRNGVAITHQTGQVQTPSVSPDGKDIVYLSDSGGHANLWVPR